MSTVMAARKVRHDSVLENWLLERVACYLERPIEDIDPTVPLAEFGIDSVSALSLCGDVEDHWQLEVDATLVFDYPTVADIASYLAFELADRPIAA
jgi:acyl carrier protein